MQYEEKYSVELKAVGGWESLGDFDLEQQAWYEFDRQADLRGGKGESYSLRVVRRTQVTVTQRFKA